MLSQGFGAAAFTLDRWEGVVTDPSPFLPPPYLSMKIKVDNPLLRLSRASYWAHSLISSDSSWTPYPDFARLNCQDFPKNQIIKHVSFLLKVAKTSKKSFCIIKLN